MPAKPPVPAASAPAPDSCTKRRRSMRLIGISPYGPLTCCCCNGRLGLPRRTSRSKEGLHMKIRDAVPADAPAACEVLRRSIIELCVADHHDDPAILERWLANKTPEIIASWIAQAASSMLVAVEAGVILAAGAVTDAGEVRLNYVSPDGRFRGVSRAML